MNGVLSISVLVIAVSEHELREANRLAGLGLAGALRLG